TGHRPAAGRRAGRRNAAGPGPRHRPVGHPAAADPQRRRRLRHRRRPAGVGGARRPGGHHRGRGLLRLAPGAGPAPPAAGGDGRHLGRGGGQRDRPGRRRRGHRLPAHRLVADLQPARCLHRLRRRPAGPDRPSPAHPRRPGQHEEISMNRHAPSLLRHLRSILAGPVTVTLVIPALILTLSGGHRLAITGPLAWAAAVLGLLLALAGLALLIWTIVLFDRVGHGTLSPLNPTQALVLVGPYRHVRNPMFTGVLAILGGESLITASPLLLAWFVLFWTALAIAIPRVEEP